MSQALAWQIYQSYSDSFLRRPRIGLNTLFISAAFFGYFYFSIVLDSVSYMLRENDFYELSFSRSRSKGFMSNKNIRIDSFSPSSTKNSETLKANNFTYSRSPRLRKYLLDACCYKFLTIILCDIIFIFGFINLKIPCVRIHPK